MKNALRKWNDTSLILRIVIGMVIGIILALLVPQATGISILGTMFVGALKAIAPLLVFVLVMSSLAQATDGIGRQFSSVIGLYLLSTLLSSVLAVIASFIFPISIQLSDVSSETAPPSGMTEVFNNLLGNIVANPIDALANANYVGVLAWAIVLGLALKKIASDHTKESLNEFSDAVSMAVRWIISCAPFGIMGLVFTTVSENGLSIFKDYGTLLLLLLGCMATIAFVVDPLIVAICLHRNPYPLVFRCLKESGVTAFFTRSSAANIPVNMALCERLGLDKNVYSVSIPLGATINMNGAAITITVMTMAAVHTLGMTVSVPTAVVLSLLSTLAACGASGVSGGSLLLIPMACSLFGISNDIAMQVVGVGFIIGVIQDSCETAINSSGDVLFAATAEFRTWIKQGREVKF